MSPVSSASPDADSAGAAADRVTLLLVHHLGSAQVGSVRRALAEGRDVICLTTDASLAPDLRSQIRVLGNEGLPGFEDGALAECTFDLVERTAEELLRRPPWLGRTLVAATGSAEVDRYLCRALLRDVGSFLGLLGFAASGPLARYDEVVVERHWPHGPDYALLASVACASDLDLPPEQVQRLKSLHFQVEHVSGPLATLRGAAHALRELAELWRDALGLVRVAPRPLPRRPFLIRTYAADWGFDRGGQRRLRNVDFIVDDSTIRRDEVVIWKDEQLHADDEAGLAERGYPVIGSGDVHVGVARFVVRVLPRLLAAVPLFLRLFSAERRWSSLVRRLLSQTLLWQEVARQVRPRVLFTVNDLQEDGIARTFVMRRAGCLCVEYEFSSHWRTDEHGWVPDYVYAFSVLDAMVSWGPAHSEHFRNHRGSIREFWEVGCVWSEHARVARDDADVAPRYHSELEGHGVDLSAWDAVVGVFDTSTASFFTADDVVAFYGGVVELARRMPRLLFLCKPKRDIESVLAAGRGGAAVAAALASAPNMVVLPRFFETAAAVGVSDVSINACFTSPAVESIGLGRPAVYFDPTGLFPRSFFRRIPRLVADDEDALAAIVRGQLALDPAELAADLRSRFEAFEGYFDGYAITRLRERLRTVLDG